MVENKSTIMSKITDSNGFPEKYQTGIAIRANRRDSLSAKTIFLIQSLNDIKNIMPQKIKVIPKYVIQKPAPFSIWEYKIRPVIREYNNAVYKCGFVSPFKILCRYTAKNIKVNIPEIIQNTRGRESSCMVNFYDCKLKILF